MELKEAKLILNYQLTTVKGTNVYSPIDYEAVETVLKELERLQKMNDAFMNEYHKRVQERIDIEQELKDSISKDKIREKIEEINKLLPDIDYRDIEDKQEREYYKKEYYKVVAERNILQNLLKEE